LEDSIEDPVGTGGSPGLGGLYCRLDFIFVDWGHFQCFGVINTSQVGLLGRAGRTGVPLSPPGFDKLCRPGFSVEAYMIHTVILTWGMLPLAASTRFWRASLLNLWISSFGGLCGILRLLPPVQRSDVLPGSS
jgi:hypothetical protein